MTAPKRAPRSTARAPTGRERVISVRVTAEQDERIVEHADAAGLEPSVYLRTLGLCPPTTDPHAQAALAAVARAERAVEQRAADREAEALRLHADEGLTLTEVGAQLGVTKQRAGQMVAKARARARTRAARWLDAEADAE